MPDDIRKGLRDLQLSMQMLIAYAEIDGTLTVDMQQGYDKIVNGISKCNQMCENIAMVLPPSNILTIL